VIEDHCLDPMQVKLKSGLMTRKLSGERGTKRITIMSCNHKDKNVVKVDVVIE
jgi:hypothetical protein